MDGTPPTPPYSVPASGGGVPPQPAPNPSGGAAAGSSVAARVLFVPPRPTTQMPPPLPNVAGAKRGAAAAGLQKSKKPRKKTTARNTCGRGAPGAPPSSHASPRPSPARAPSTAAATSGARQVLDQMATSVDDDAFLGTMNVGSSFSEAYGEQQNEEEEEYEVDDEGEGLIDAPKGRSANYTVEEDRLLCKTWLKIGMDPTVGTDQTRDTYWARMKEYFDANNTSANERTDRSLRSRWSLINADCQKWAGVQKDIDILNPSGTNDVDRLNMGQSLFKDEGRKNKKGKPIPRRLFVFFHCYEVLCNEEKWKTRGGVDVLAKKAAEATINLDEDATSGDDNKQSSTPHSVAKTRRPFHGKKVTKDMKGRKAGDDDIAKAMERMVNARLEANEDRKMARSLEAEAEARRTALEERMADVEERKVALEEKNTTRILLIHDSLNPS